MSMNKPKISYFAEEDILHLLVAEGPETSSVELGPNITAELNEKGEMIGLEILSAATFLRDSVMESAQARLAGFAAKP